MEEPLDPNKFHVLSPNYKKKLIVATVIALFILVPTFSFFYYKTAVNRPSQTEKEQTFEIKRGDNVFEVAESLYVKDAVNSKVLFILYMYLNRLDKSMQAGSYTIKAGSTVVNLANLFMHGTNDIKITFLEGWRVEEFAREAANNLSGVDYKKFIESAKPYEGYLFPDTYFLRDDAQTSDLIEVLRTTFEEKTKDIFTDASLKTANLTKEQVVTLASMLEREANNNVDKSIIAGILIKRLREGMKLDVDATVQYALTFQNECQPTAGTCSPLKSNPSDIEWWPQLKSDDLSIDSPYNTRKVAGLPPTPICNVSLSSIEAVLKIKPSSYYFYLTDDSGVTHYAKTLEEHNQNISKYLAK